MLTELGEQYPKAISEFEASFSQPDTPKSIVDVDYLRELTKGDTDLEQLFEDMLQYFYSYTEILLQYYEFQFGKKTGHVEKEEIDAEEARLDENRKRVHDATIDSVNILARALQRTNRDSSWISKLKSSRALYGHLALTTTFNKLTAEKQRKETAYAQ